MALTGSSLATSLPGADLGTAELRAQMAAFTAKFDDFTDRRKRAVLEDKNDFQRTVERIKETHRSTRADVAAVTRATASTTTLLTSQSSERDEIKHSIHQLESQRDAASSHRDALLAAKSSLRSAIATKQAAMSARRRHASAQAKLNAPELDFWETYLAFRIEGAGAVDRLRFVFGCLGRAGGDGDGGTTVDASSDNQAWFELGTGERDYKVIKWEPTNGVDPDQVRRCVDRLNHSRDLAPFLKQMRDLFVHALNDS